MTWKTFMTTAGLSGLLLAFMLYIRREKEAGKQTSRANIFKFLIIFYAAIQRERARVLGKAAIGGAFSLVDHNGTLKTSQDFKGEWLLIYFGFTHCPDICPDEIQKLIKVVDALGIV